MTVPVTSRLVRTAAAVIVCLALVGRAPLQGQDAEAASQALLHGQQLLDERHFPEAVSAFNELLTKYPGSAVADDALYEVARYQFEVVHDPRATAESIDRLLKQYGTSDSVPRARVLQARIALAAAASPEQTEAVVGSLEGIARQSAGSDVASEALYYAAQAARLGGRPDDAATRFADLAARYPSSSAVPRSLLAAASSLVAAGRPTIAFEPLQRLRTRFPTAPEAAVAAEWITTLYRFYLRAPAQPAYVYATSIATAGGRIRDFRDLGTGAANHLFVATKSSLIEFGTGGDVLKSTEMPDTRGVIIDRAGRPVVIGDDGGLRAEGQPVLSLATARSDGKLEALRLDAGVVTSAGDVIVTNHDQRTLVRFGVDGKPKGEFARAIAARRVAVDELDQIAALDSDAKAVVVFGRDGKVAGRIPARGPGYQFKQPIDIAFDRLGHLYVLDRAALYVFTPQRTLLTTFTVPEKSPGGFSSAEAFALDSAARLFLFDSRSSAVQVYR